MLTLLRLETDYPDDSPGDGGFPLPTEYVSMCRVATGRSALYHLANRLPEPHAFTVLLPCFVAEGVIKPFMAADFKVIFYPLTADLRPDETAVADILDEIPGRAVFVLIHYFGFSAASPSLLAVLESAGAWVVSDCAHAPLSRSVNGASLGELGDFALYSLNKWLPVCDGAILLSRSPEVSVAIDDAGLPTLPNAATDAFLQHLAACRALFFAEEIAKARETLTTIGTSYEAYYEVINNDMKPHRQSDASRRIEGVFQYQDSARIRRSHTERLLREMRSDLFVPVHSCLPIGVVPFCFPVRVPAHRREELQNFLIGRGILLSTLVDKWDFVPAGQAGDFINERDFIAEHLLVPVNEFLSDADMSTLISELNQIR